MTTWDPYDEPEFEGIFERQSNRPVMTMPPRMVPSAKLVAQIRIACDLDHATAERVAYWAADWGERLGARTAQPVIDMDGSGPICSWCGMLWPLCGHHHLSEEINHDDEETARD